LDDNWRRWNCESLEIVSFSFYSKEKNPLAFLNLHRTPVLSCYPSNRRKKDSNGIDKGVIGSIDRLASTEIASQPVLGFDWNSSMDGLCVLGTLDQSLHVALVTELGKC